MVESLRNTGKLPDEYITKSEARSNGWDRGKAVGTTNPGKQLGGDLFKNTDNLLPEAKNRIWTEVDIGLDSLISRAKQPGTRLVYSNDGLLFITTDHYESFFKIGEWK